MYIGPPLISPLALISRYLIASIHSLNFDVRPNAEVIVESLRPIREQYNDLLNNKDYLEKVYAIGAEKAERQARKTLRKVYKKVGLIERKFL